MLPVPPRSLFSPTISRAQLFPSYRIQSWFTSTFIEDFFSPKIPQCFWRMVLGEKTLFSKAALYQTQFFPHPCRTHGSLPDPSTVAWSLHRWSLPFGCPRGWKCCRSRCCRILMDGLWMKCTCPKSLGCSITPPRAHHLGSVTANKIGFDATLQWWHPQMFLRCLPHYFPAWPKDQRPRSISQCLTADTEIDARFLSRKQCASIKSTMHLCKNVHQSHSPKFLSKARSPLSPQKGGKSWTAALCWDGSTSQP